MVPKERVQMRREEELEENSEKDEYLEDRLKKRSQQKFDFYLLWVKKKNLSHHFPMRI